MLLKCSNLEPGKGNGKLTRASTVMRMTMSTGSTMSSRVHRKIVRIPSKRHPGKALPGKLHSVARVSGKVLPGKRLRPNQTAHCDNSNDSGLGVEQYADTPYANSIRQLPSTRWGQSTSSTTTSESAAMCSNPIHIDEASSSSSSSASQSMYEMTNQTMPSQTQIQTNANNENSQMHDHKRQKLQQQLIDSEDTCSNDAFIFKLNQNGPQFNSNRNIPAVKIPPISRSLARPAIRRSNLGSQMVNAPNNNIGVSGPVTLQSQIGAISQNGKYQLQILAQPEQQHRARYQTEGSRGAVKDRSGNGFPIVKLLSYDKAVTLQIFIGTDVGRVSPHMFYQACKVSGKNSTPCNEKKVEGTILIETDLKPENDMTATCDCVGILKERNVDVEHRFPDQTTGPRSKKKSTRCRMVFRTQITHDDGTIETLQVCSQQIICTQPPGVPEICKKSLISSPATGGLELFIIGKNFLKDTRVIFQARRVAASPDSYDTFWEESVMPDKEFLQQTHLICTVPSYIDVDIVEPVTVQMLVTSSNKYSEPHNFVYTPKSTFGPTGLTMTPTLATLQHIHSSQDLGYGKEETRSTSPTSTGTMKRSTEPCPTLMLWAKHLKDSNKNDAVSLMPPPATTLPMNIRRSSFSSGLLGSCSSDQISPPLLKSEIIDENSQNSIHSTGADSMNHDSMDTFNNENSMDTNSQGAIMTQSPLELIMQGPVMNQSGLLNISSTSPINGIDLRVKQEKELSAQMQELVNPGMNENSNSSFMTPFTAKVNDLKIQVNEVPMFNAQSNLMATSPEAMLRNSLNAMNCKTATTMVTDPQMQTAIEHQTNVFNAPTLMTEAGTASGLNHMLSFPTTTQAISPNLLATSPTNQSPLSADVMLNSQPINQMNTSSALMAAKAANNNMTSGINSGIQTESDIIMNPTISPTMMCSNASNENASLISNNVAMSDATMLTAPPQPASETLLNNLIQPMTIEQSDAAVKNMILNAAAEILSSEPNSITHETTSNALMSLNGETSVTQQSQHSNSPTITNILTHTDSTSSVVVLAGNNKVIQNVVEAAIVQNAHEIIQNHVVPADSIQMGTFAQNSQVVNVQPVTTASAAAANLSPAQQSLLSNIQQEIHAASIETIKGDEITSTLENMVQKQRKLSEPMETNNSVVVQNTQQVTTPNVVPNGRLPQDITAMSEHDLISYINPSCFDQGMTFTFEN